MTDSNSSSSEKNGEGGTRIDLGEDLLLEKTKALERESRSEGFQFGGRDGVSDLPQSAKILISEGLIEDAKKILRQLLIYHPTSTVAKQTLNEIHRIELEKIFRVEEVPRFLRKASEHGLPKVDPEALMRQLDHDLGLGVFEESRGLQESSFSLFQDPEVSSAYATQLEKSLENGAVKDWIDLGIAFMEMELYSIAIQLFTGACRKMSSEADESREVILSATSLLALALMKAGRPFEALSKIQPILQDSEVSRESKIEIFYLMGRVYDSIKKFELALQFYQQVVEIDPHYRDVERRLRERNEG